MQDLTSWTRDGIAGLQSVVLYSLPELDGAIDTVPLGGLMGNNIFLVPERVKRLSARLRKWVNLRRTPKHVRPALIIAVVCKWKARDPWLSQAQIRSCIHRGLRSKSCSLL